MTHILSLESTSGARRSLFFAQDVAASCDGEPYMRLHLLHLPAGRNRQENGNHAGAAHRGRQRDAGVDRHHTDDMPKDVTVLEWIGAQREVVTTKVRYVRIDA